MASMLSTLPMVPVQANAGPGVGASPPGPADRVDGVTASPEPARLTRTEGGQAARAQGEGENGRRGRISSEALDQAVSRLQEYVQVVRRNLEFSIDESTDRLVVKVVDAETEEVVRQIPSEEALAIARRLEEMRERREGGLLFTSEA